MRLRNLLGNTPTIHLQNCFVANELLLPFLNTKLLIETKTQITGHSNKAWAVQLNFQLILEKGKHYIESPRFIQQSVPNASLR